MPRQVGGAKRLLYPGQPRHHVRRHADRDRAAGFHLAEEGGACTYELGVRRDEDRLGPLELVHTSPRTKPSHGSEGRHVLLTRSVADVADLPQLVLERGLVRLVAPLRRIDDVDPEVAESSVDRDDHFFNLGVAEHLARHMIHPGDNLLA